MKKIGHQITYSNRILFFLTGFLTIGSVYATIAIISHTRSFNHPSDKIEVIFSDDSLSRKSFTFLQELHDTKINDDTSKEDSIVGSIIQILLQTESRVKRIKTDTTISIVLPIRKPTEWEIARMQELKEKLSSNLPLERKKEIQEELNRIYMETTGRAGIDRVTPLK